MADSKPPAYDDDEYVNLSYARDADDVTDDVNRSFSAAGRASPSLQQRSNDADVSGQGRNPTAKRDNVPVTYAGENDVTGRKSDSVAVAVDPLDNNAPKDYRQDYDAVNVRDRHNYSFRRDDSFSDDDDDDRHDVMNSSRLRTLDVSSLEILNTSALDHSFADILPSSAADRSFADNPPTSAADRSFVDIPLSSPADRSHDSLDSVLAEAVRRPGHGLENEAYFGDEETATDLSFHNNSFQYVTDDVDGQPGSVVTRPERGIVPDRPTSGRYAKNPAIERKRPLVALGPYDPQNRIFLAPLPAHKPDFSVMTEPQKPRRIPRPPSKLKIKCAYFWSCFACLTGNFLCAIPALRYTVTASNYRKEGDCHKSHSYLKKSYILAGIGIILAIAGWTILILYLSHAAFR